VVPGPPVRQGRAQQVQVLPERPARVLLEQEPQLRRPALHNPAAC
jgi:hypothetical protein